MTLLTKKLTGAPTAVVWFFPVLSLVFFILPYIPLLGQIPFLTQILKNISIIYRAILIPAYDTYKTIEHRGDNDAENMLSYWLIVGLTYTIIGIMKATLANNFFDLVLYLIVILITTWNYTFAVIIYKAVVRPFINSLRDDAVNQAKEG